MEIFIAVIAIGLISILVLLGYAMLFRELREVKELVRVGNKDQQEIKTAQEWSKKRQHRIMKELGIKKLK